jgi:hypothetical protein
MSRDTESPPGNANGQRQLAGCNDQLTTTTSLVKLTDGVKLISQRVRQWRRQPVRYFLCLLPWGLDRLAWIGLPNPKRGGWGSEEP